MFHINRERRGVSRTLAARCCPELVIQHCLEVLYKKSHACPKRLRTREHWEAESENVFKAWGLHASPAVDDMLDALERVGSKSRRVDVQQLSLDGFLQSRRRVVNTSSAEAAEACFKQTRHKC